jgi:hypothetical protein
MLFRKKQSNYYPTPIRKVKRWNFRLPEFHFSWKKFLLYGGAFCSLIFLIYIFVFSSIFKIHSVAVFNSKFISAEKLSAEIKKEFSGKHIYLVSESKVADFVHKKYPKIVDIKVEKHWPDGLVIKLREEAIILLWKTAGRIYGVNEKGAIFAAGAPPPPPPSPENPTETPTPRPTPTPAATPLTVSPTVTFTVTNTPTATPVPYPPLSDAEISAAAKTVPLVVDESNLPVALGKQVVTSEFVQFLNDVKANLSKRLSISVSEFRVKETTFEVFAVTNKFGIYFDTMRGAAEQIETLARVLNAGYQIWEYADLRIENKVYYK